ncbi:MAG: paraquat-inducible protein A [Alphaproteobacteria bacterium]|nr:paraquat-inducible protein A [Alphaproteobacteria bacterium]
MNNANNPARPLVRRLAALFDDHLAWWLGGTAILLVAGWLLPVMTVKTMVVFSDQVSILDGTFRLLDSGDIMLFLIVFVFTILFPAIKLIVAATVLRKLDRASGRLHRLLGWIEALGRWSMLDVFVAALLVVVIKLSMVSDVVIHSGLYVFAAAVVLSIVVVRRVARRARTAAIGADGGDRQPQVSGEPE